MTRPTRDVVLNVRLTDQELDRVDVMAKESQMTRSEWARAIIAEAAGFGRPAKSAGAQ